MLSLQADTTRWRFLCRQVELPPASSFSPLSIAELLLMIVDALKVIQPADGPRHAREARSEMMCYLNEGGEQVATAKRTA